MIFLQMQKLSTPLLFLSVTSALGDLSSKSDEADDGPSSTTGAPDLPAESNETSSTSDTRLVRTSGRKTISSFKKHNSIFSQTILFKFDHI